MLPGALPLVCPRCGAPLPEVAFRPVIERCGRCDRDFEVLAFAPQVPVAGAPALAAAGPVEATACARHPHNAAIANCARCGVFMCGLCRIDLDGHELCPTCFDRLTTEGQVATTRTSFLDASGLALALALLSFLFSCFAVVTGPVAIGLAIVGLRQKKAWREVGGRGQAIAAIVLGSLLIVLGVALLILVFVGMTQKK